MADAETVDPPKWIAVPDCADGLVPNEPFVDCNPMTFTNPPELVLKRHLLVMLLLVFDVAFDFRDLRFTHREDSSAGLPIEVLVLVSFRFDPLRRIGLDFADDLLDRVIPREIRFCLMDQRLRRVVGESDVFQSVIAGFALKLREGKYHFDTPSDLVGLLKTMARTHVAHLARFWQARRRDLRKNRRIDTEGATEPAAHDPTVSSVVARVEMLEHALERLPERDRQILDWRQDNVTWPEIARRLNVPSSEALRKQHERALARVAEVVYPRE